jgi:hypothetical protein
MSNIYDLADTWNNGATTFASIKMNVTNTASAAASQLLDLQTGGTQRFGVRAPHIANGSNTTPFLNLVDVWNTSGTITGLKYNVTDTASAAASLLMDLQRGSNSLFAVGRTSNQDCRLILSRSSGADAAAVYLEGGSGYLTCQRADVGVIFESYSYGINVFQLRTTTLLTWGTAYSSYDLVLTRDAADTLAQRRTTNAQTFRTYGTYTDASNYRRVALAMTTGGVATLQAEGAGTGSSGNVLHISSLPTSNPGAGILWNNAGTPAIGT